jgi:hypothetical protein
MWAELGSWSSWPVTGDRSWGLHDLPQILKIQEIWPHHGDMGTYPTAPLHRSPAQGRSSQDHLHHGVGDTWGRAVHRHLVAEESTHVTKGTDAQPHLWSRRSKGQVEPGTRLPPLLPAGPPQLLWDPGQNLTIF